ncbi:C-C motif chemokine 20-like [Solea senegalensis]|uniref:C-C motif chemokine n=1 Tax=Solea senegalensis TaxID=28829 RepID=A0AAV6TBU1_SOLSE|nr:C-C motif chemokine 20b [Solea senegalensis]KAG7526989.1 C-C motif chemokine 20-like [Solea senegalensis]
MTSSSSNSNMRVMAALCTIVILSTFIRSTQSTACCLMYTKRHLSCRRLLDYTVQTINTSCDINAIIFHRPGRFVCADPSKSWTQRAMKCVDDMKRRIAQITKEKILQ